MTNNLWVLQAFTAAILWGFTYAVSGRILQQGISVPTLLIIESLFVLPLYFALVAFKGTFKTDMALIMGRPGLLSLVVGLSCLFVAANFMIASSIAAKNATLAALLEITYPLFTFAFTWLIFRENQLNWATAAGGVLIFLGTTVIYFKG